MAKKVSLTESIKAAIKAQVGDDIDYSKIAVYEAAVVSTRPINQRYSAYNNARISEGYLTQMVDYLGAQSVPLQIMHQGGFLPIGKVFQAQKFTDPDGEVTLNAMFYVKEASEFAEDIDLGITDEVSIGALPSHALCSECGYNYAEPGNEMAFYYRECDNGHELGLNGVHLRLTGLASWDELSLVNKGASKNPKILGSSQRRISKENFTRLAAASGSDSVPELMYLQAGAVNQPSPPPSPKDTKMDLTALTAQVAELSKEAGRTSVTVENLTAQLSTANDSLTAATAKNVELEAALAAKNPEELETNLAATKQELEAAQVGVTFLSAQYKHACVAAGLTFKDGASVPEMIESLNTAQVKLAAIPRGGISLDSESQGKESVKHSFSANLAYVNL